MPACLTAAAAAATVAGGGVKAYGAYEAGQAEQGADKYNAAIATENANIALKNAGFASAAGEAQVATSEMRTKAGVGATKVNQAAGNIDVNSGSAVNVRSSEESLGALDALNLRSNAVREAYGYETKAASDEATAKLDIASGKQAALAGEINAGATLLTAAGSAGSSVANFNTQGSVPGGGTPTPSTAAPTNSAWAAYMSGSSNMTAGELDPNNPNGYGTGVQW